MSEIGDAVYRMITGRTSDETGSFMDMRSELIGKYGTYGRAARHAGIPRTTWRYWEQRIAAGATPRPMARVVEKLQQAVWAARVDRPQSEDAIRIETEDRSDNRPRTLTNHNLKLPAGAMKRVAQVYAATGDKEAAARQFLNEIRDPTGFYQNYLMPRKGQTGASLGGTAGAEDGDDGAEFDEDDESTWDEWYDDSDLAYEGHGAGDSDTYSGGIVLGVG